MCDSVLLPGDVEVAQNTWISPFAVLGHSGCLENGHNCSIIACIQTYTYDTMKWATCIGALQPEFAPVRIRLQSFICANAIITNGATIGVACVIGACGLVNTGFPDSHKECSAQVKIIRSINND